MHSVNRSFFQALLAMTGGIVGAGVFGLPAVFARIGLVWGTVLYLGLACVVAAMHLLYVEVHLAVGSSHRLSGAAERILGPFIGKIAAITYPANLLGTSLIYILLGGSFITSLIKLTGVIMPDRIIQTIYWFIVAICVYRGLRTLAKIESYTVRILIGLLFIVSMIAWGGISPALGRLLFAWDGTMIPLGVLLFSLTGLPAVGQVVDLVKRDRVQAYHAVVGGTLLAALLSWFFGVSWAFLLVPTGQSFAVVPTGLKVITVLLPLIGFFSVMTAHLITATDLLNVFHLDFEWRKHHAWIAAVVPPLLFLFIFREDLLHLMDAMGAIFSAFNAILVCLMALTLAIRSSQRTNWVIGVSALLTGMVFVTILFQKLASFVLPSSV